MPVSACGQTGNGSGSQATFRVNNTSEMKSAFQAIGKKATEGLVIGIREEYSLDTFSSR
jgi:hypothetical protein